MIFKVKFSEENTTFKAQFGEIQTVGGTGGYQEGYEYGYKIGKTEGEKIGYQNGISQGEALGYEKGYAQGENDGYLKGHSIGTTEGYQTGYSKGVEEGQLVGYEKGKTDGHKEGYNEGYLIGEQKGYETGYNSGHSDGYEKGKTEGHTEGYNSGIAEGKLQGYTEGYAEGYEKGLTDGEAVGYQKGLKDGEEIGYQKGYIAGETQGYNAGYSEGDSDGYERGHGEGLTAGYENGYNVGFEEGKQSSGVDYDTAYNEGYEKGFTDGQESVPNYLYYARILDNVFGGVVFPENFNFVLKTKGDFAKKDSIAYIFNNSRNLKSVKLVSENRDFVLDITSSFAIAWDGTPTLEIVDLTEFNKKFSKLFNTFRYQKVLKSILGKMDLSECTNTTNTFQNCEALEDIEFESGTIKISISFAQSPKLSATSIQSIIDGLATGLETTQTLTLSNKVVVTDEQKAVIQDKKCWTLVQ